MKRLGLMVTAALLATPAAAGDAPYREFAVKVEAQTVDGKTLCKVVAISEPNAEAAKRACQSFGLHAGPERAPATVRIWLPLDRDGVVVPPADARPRTNYVTTEDGLDRLNGRRPASVSVVYVVNAQGRIEQCLPQLSTTPAKLAAAVCELITKRFEFRPATLNGTPIAYPEQRGFMVPGRSR